MKRLGLLAAAVVLVSAAGPGLANSPLPLERYEARLSGRDHFNSNGVALTTAAAIIRQDRANYHVMGYRDRDDQDDTFFRIVRNRTRLEQLLNRRGGIAPEVSARILNDDPMVIVEVYEDGVQVTLKEARGGWR